MLTDAWRHTLRADARSRRPRRGRTRRRPSRAPKEHGACQRARTPVRGTGRTGTPWCAAAALRSRRLLFLHNHHTNTIDKHLYKAPSFTHQGLKANRYNHTRCVQATGDARAAVCQHGTTRARIAPLFSLHRSGSLKSSFNFFFKLSIHKRTGRCVLRPQDDEVLLGLPCTGLLRHRSTSDPSGSAVLVWVRHVFVVQLIHVGLLMIPSPRTKMHLLNQ